MPSIWQDTKFHCPWRFNHQFYVAMRGCSRNVLRTFHCAPRSRRESPCKTHLLVWQSRQTQPGSHGEKAVSTPELTLRPQDRANGLDDAASVCSRALEGCKLTASSLCTTLGVPSHTQWKTWGQTQRPRPRWLAPGEVPLPHYHLPPFNLHHHRNMVPSANCSNTTS